MKERNVIGSWSGCMFGFKYSAVVLMLLLHAFGPWEKDSFDVHIVSQSLSLSRISFFFVFYKLHSRFSIYWLKMLDHLTNRFLKS